MISQVLGNLPAVKLFRLLRSTNRGLAYTTVTLAVLQGLLFPAFAIATGALVSALRSGGSVAVPLLLLGVLFSVQRVLGPLTATLGIALARQVDEALTERVMRAMSSPPGLAHIENAAVLDKVAQAQGALTGVTPGEAAHFAGFVVQQRVSGVASLLVVARYNVGFALLLGVVYAAAYRVVRWHWHQMTLVLYGRTGRLRRAYYLRTTALTGDVAKETRVFGLAGWLVDRYRASWRAVMTDVWRSRREAWGIMAITYVVLGAAEALVLVSLARAAAAGSVGLGTAVAVAQASLAAGALAMFQDGHWGIAEAVKAIDLVLELEQSSDVEGAVGGGTLPAADLPRQSIRLEQVTFRYPGRDESVFDHLDLEIEVGRSLAIVGANGAGKTTLVKLLFRLYDPTAGRILVDGVDLRELDPEQWRRRLAAVFQDYVQYEVSAFDNVAFGAVGHDEAERVDRAAQLAGATALVDRLPQGWETVLSREYAGGTQLSGGEWQRLALARAVFALEAGAGVLVLDEPTAAMDVRGESEVYDRFLELTRGVTTIVISHRFSTVRRADRIVVIDHGRVVEDGTHNELVAAGGRYARMYGLQAARFQDEERSDA